VLAKSLQFYEPNDESTHPAKGVVMCVGGWVWRLASIRDGIAEETPGMRMRFFIMSALNVKMDFRTCLLTMWPPSFSSDPAPGRNPPFFWPSLTFSLCVLHLQLFIIRGLIKINGLLSVIAIILCDLTFASTKAGRGRVFPFIVGVFQGGCPVHCFDIVVFSSLTTQRKSGRVGRSVEISDTCVPRDPESCFLLSVYCFRFPGLAASVDRSGKFRNQVA